MANPLSRLQNAHNGGLRLVAAVGRDLLVRGLVLLLGLLGLQLVDLEAEALVRKVVVDAECVGGANVLALGVLGQGPQLCAGKRLQRALCVDGG